MRVQQRPSLPGITTMNKLVQASLAMALSVPAVSAFAQCTGTGLNAGPLTTLLSGNTECGRPAPG